RSSGEQSDETGRTGLRQLLWSFLAVRAVSWQVFLTRYRAFLVFALGFICTNDIHFSLVAAGTTTFRSGVNNVDDLVSAAAQNFSVIDSSRETDICVCVRRVRTDVDVYLTAILLNS